MFDKPWRNHPALILERCFSVLWLFIIILIGDITRIVNPTYWKEAINLLKQGDYTVFFSGAGGVIILAVCILLFYRQWSRTYFRIENKQLIVDKKTIFKKTSRLPIENITTVNLESNVFEQLFNISKVKIDINSSSSADKTDFTFLMKTELAAQFKAHITELKSGEAEIEAVNQAVNPPECLAFFSVKDIIKNAFISLTPMPAFVIAATLLYSYYETISLYLFVKTIPILILLTLAMHILLLLSHAANHYNFTLGMDGDNILINRGFFKKRSYTFSKRKIKAVIIKQSLIARILGLYSVDVAVIGLGNEKNETPSLVLYMKKERLDAILNVCLSGFVYDAPQIKSAKKGLNMLLFKAAFAAFFIWFFAFLPSKWTIIIPAVLTIILFIIAYLSYRTKSIAYDENCFSMTSGIFSRKTVILRYNDIRKTEILTNIYLEKHKVAKMRSSILSSSKLNNYKTGYFNLEYFDVVLQNN